MSSVFDEHLGYVADAVRLEQFRSAVAQVVQPGDRVADVGCGSAVLGLLCLQAGAGHVDAVDSTAAIEIARQSLTAAGWGGRSSFIHGKSFQVELPEAVDVVICDHVGYFGFDYGLIEMMADARRRFLKPGGRLIPGRLRLQLGAVESDKCSQLAEGWQAHSQPLFNQGPGYTAGTTAWKVSGLLPRGNYRLIDRRGDQARLVDGYRLEVDGQVMKDTYLFLPSGYGGVEAVEERYVLASTRP